MASYSISDHAKALLKRPTARMAETTRFADTGKAALGIRPESENFSEDVGHGFSGGGAQSSAVQPTDLLGAPAMLGDLAKMGAKAATTWADSRGLAQLYEALAKETPKLRNLGGQVGRFYVAPGEAALAAKSATNLAKEAEPSLMTRAQEVLKSLTQPGYKTPQAMEAAEARGIPGRIQPEVPSNPHVRNTPSPVDAATNAAGKTPRSYAPGQAPHPAGMTPRQVVDKQVGMLQRYMAEHEAAGHPHEVRAQALDNMLSELQQMGPPQALPPPKVPRGR